MAAIGPRARRTIPLGVSGRAPLVAATRRPPAPWRVRDALLVMAAGLVFLLVTLVTTTGAAQLQGLSPSDSDAKAAISSVVFAAFYLFLLWMIHVIIAHRYRVGWRQLGLRPVSWQWLAAAVPFMCALLTLTYVLLLRGATVLFGKPEQWPAPLTSTAVHATQIPALEVLVILTYVLLAPFTEELLFRGVFYQALRRNMGMPGSVLLSALLFAGMHLSIVLFIPFTILGVVLALVYERSGSIIPTILVHACNNGIILLIVAGATSAS
jgi:membrane protease YdiL (CAAX protease family)